MKQQPLAVRSFLIGAALVSAAAACAAQGPSSAAVAGFDQYVSGVDARIQRQHETPGALLESMDATQAACLRQGEVLIERLTPAQGEELPGALLHDWRGAAFVPGATAPEFEEMLRDFAAYPREFSPQVLETRLLAGQGDRFQLEMRARQRHVIEVTLDGTYDVRFGRLDADDGWSTSQSTRMQELGSDGKPLSAGAEHGLLWRLDTWWSYEQRNGGLYVQMESVSLTRAIPAGLGWMVGPFVDQIPRESLVFTLRAACAAVRRPENRPVH